MNAALALLLAGMAVLDLAVPIPRIEFRAVVQGICVLVALMCLVRGNRSEGGFGKFLPIFIYLVIICLSSVTSGQPLFVLTQCASLGAVIIFAVVYAAKPGQKAPELQNRFALIISLVLAPFIFISAAQFIFGFGNALEYSTGRYRLEGVYEEPATLAAMAGIFIGASWLAPLPILVRIAMLSTALTCLIGTGSRTFMIASGLAVAAMIAFYFKHWRWKALTALAFLAIIAGVAGKLGYGPGASLYQDYARVDSVKTLTGRTEIWSSAFHNVRDSWALGFGFTLGTQAAHYPGLPTSNSDIRISNRPDSGATSQAKLHSGYVQAILDTGAIGGATYFLVILMAWFRLLANDRSRRLPLLMYLLCFFTVANGAETIIHSASVLRSVLAWMVIVMCLSIEVAPRAVTSRYAGRFVS